MRCIRRITLWESREENFWRGAESPRWRWPCAGASLTPCLTGDPARFRTQLNASSLAQFVDPLPLPEVISAERSSSKPGESRGPTSRIYRVAMRQFESQVHRDLKPTRFWGYGSTSPGPTFETRSGQGVAGRVGERTPEKHFLPIDHSIHGAEADKPEVRAVVHLHGAKAPAGK
jgi:spore coat protein A, manganese oxidase